MSAIVIRGVDRPGLEPALARHGLIAAGLLGAQLIGAAPAAALVAAGVAAPLRPALVEAADCDAAVALLGWGGADHVVLASDPDALVAARLAALVRRGDARRLVVGDLAIDLVERRAARGGRPLALLPREYALLVRLARAAGAIVSRAALTHEVLGLPFDPGTNVLTVHLSRLRAKLHAGGGAPMLMTEKGRGYRLAAGVAGR